eukprot:9243188-Alexandrium_andersonii.AAC.1
MPPGGVQCSQLPSADRWLLRLVGRGHFLGPDVLTALRLDSVLAVLLKDLGAEELSRSFQLAAACRIVCPGRWGPL